MKRILSVVIALVCLALLSSCSLLPDIPTPGNDDTDQKANVQMRRIEDAVKHHDAAALEKLFSPRAREKATNLDGGLKYFLSFFPSGRMTWKVEDGGPGGGGLNDYPMEEWESFASYKVIADGKKYDLYFADITTDTDHPDSVGIYALGVVPYAEEANSSVAAKSPFDLWASQFWTAKVGSGTPGVYVPHK
jgi:hypothetical protein